MPFSLSRLYRRSVRRGNRRAGRSVYSAPEQCGRCGHICNASYAVKRTVRGQHIGEKLVKHCIAQGKTCGFRVLQFNAVVKSNKGALALYKSWDSHSLV